MSGQTPNTLDIEQIGRKMSDMERRILELEQRQIRIPVLAADPPVASPCNIWLLHDGRLRTRKLNTAGNAYVIDEWVRSAPGSSTSSTLPASPTAAPTSRQGVYPAVWSRSYKADGNARTDDGVTRLYYGWRDATNGRNRSYIGFDYTTIASDLAGSTVQSVTLSIVNLDAASPTGSDVTFGIHNVSGGTAPATWSGTVASNLDTENLRIQQKANVVLPLAFATYIRDGLGKGIAMEATDDSPTHAGYAAGFASGYDIPTLTIVYAK